MTPPTWRELVRELPAFARFVVAMVAVAAVLVVLCAEVGVAYGRWVVLGVGR